MALPEPGPKRQRAKRTIGSAQWNRCEGKRAPDRSMRRRARCGLGPAEFGSRPARATRTSKSSLCRASHQRSKQASDLDSNVEGLEATFELQPGYGLRPTEAACLPPKR